jgi:hypothetical protein
MSVCPLVLRQVYWPLLCTTVIAGACSSIGSLGASVSVERECPKVLCGSNTAALSKINSGVCLHVWWWGASMQWCCGFHKQSTLKLLLPAWQLPWHLNRG